MHVYFSGIGGTGIGPLALVAKQAGHEVSGSDKQNSDYIEYLKKHGVNDIHIGQSYEQIAEVNRQKPIDWLVYTSALTMENPDPPELTFARQNNIKASKRDELINQIISDKKLKLIAIAGTHGKTTTTAMTIWAMKRLGLPLTYILPAKSSFAEMGAYESDSKYFVLEADEFDRNFLSFKPELTLIAGIGYDHPDIYLTRDDYNQAFADFMNQSKKVFLWHEDAHRLGIGEIPLTVSYTLLEQKDLVWANSLIKLPGAVNRRDAALVAKALSVNLGVNIKEIAEILQNYPGVARRFEQIAPGLYSDYAHTPEKIRGALQLAHEIAGDNLVVVYEGLHNTRQHFIKSELVNLFEGVKKLIIVPSYLAREDESLKLLTPEDLKRLTSSKTQKLTETAKLDANLAKVIADYLKNGDTVLCLTAGGGNSLDEWLRIEFKK